MFLFTSDPRMEYLLRPSIDDLIGLEDNIRRLQKLLISPAATGYHPYQQKSSGAHVLYSSTANAPDLLFQYASTLVSHTKPSYLHEGIAILENLVFEHWTRARHQLEKHSTRPYRGAASSSCEVSDGDEEKEGREEEVVKPQPPTMMNGIPLRATAPMSDSVMELDMESEKEQARLEASEALLPVCYYYLAVGWVKLEDYDKARRAVERMLELKPGHPQGEVLRSYIDKEQTKEGVVGIAGVALALAATAGLAIAGLSRRR